LRSPLLRLDGVSKTFGGRRPLETLRDVSLEVQAGDFVSIVGPSGCGKSTLFNLVAGVLDATSGEISIGGKTSPDFRRASCGYMFQQDLLFPWRDVVANAALGLEVAGICSRAEARDRARALLPRFGLEGFESAHPAELSGGMRQRVALLRTLLLQRPLLLLDEPFASLDAITRAEMQTWLAGVLATDAHTVLLVTHDVEEALYLSDRVAVMTPRPGRISTELEVASPRAPDRAAAVTSPAFAALKAEALRALAGDIR
jgi:ABC-type nitrate/sulfonate/bicarbonate transport system ATPase subunit